MHKDINLTHITVLLFAALTFIFFSVHARATSSESYKNTNNEYTPRLVVQTSHAYGISDVAYAPDGSLIATASADRTTRLWDRKSGRLINIFRGHHDGVESVAFSKDGKFLLTCSLDNTARIINVATGAVKIIFRGHKSYVTFGAFSSDSKTAITTGPDGIRIWDVTSGKQLHHIKGIRKKAAASPDGKLLATAKDYTVEIRSTSSKEIIHKYSNERTIKSIGFSPNNKLFAVGTEESVTIWDIEKNQRHRFTNTQRVNAEYLSFSPDSNFLVTAGQKDNILRLWNIKTNELIYKHELADKITGTRFSPTHNEILVAYQSGEASIFNVDVDERVDAELSIGIESSPDSVTVSDDSRLMFVSTYLNSGVMIDLTNGKELYSTKDIGITFSCSLFSPSGKYFLTCGADGITRLHDVKNGDVIKEFIGHERGVTSAAFSHDEQLLLTGGEDEVVILWKLSNKKELSRFKLDFFGRKITSVSFSHDNKIIAAGDGGGDTYLWNVSTGELIKKIEEWSFSGDIILTHFIQNGMLIIGSEHGLYAYDTNDKIGLPVYDKSFTRFKSLKYIPANDSFLAVDSEHKRISTIKIKGFSYKQQYLVDDEYKKWDHFFDLAWATMLPNTKVVLGLTSFYSKKDSSFIYKIEKWDLAERISSVMDLQGYAKPIDAAKISEKTGLIYTKSSDRSINYWPTMLRSNNKQDILTDTPYASSFDIADNGSLGVAGKNNSVIVYSLETGRTNKTFGYGKPVKSVAISHDGKFVAAAGGKQEEWPAHALTNPLARIFTSKDVTYNSTIKLWTINGDKDPFILGSHDTTITSLDIPYPGKYVLSASDDGIIKFWNINNKQLIMEYKTPNIGVTSAVLSHDGKFIIAAYSDRTVRVWDVVSGKLLKTIGKARSIIKTFLGAEEPKIIKNSSGKTTLKFKIDFIAGKLSKGYEKSIASISRDGRLIAAGHEEGDVYIWDTKNNKIIHELIGHSSRITSIYYIPNTKLLLTSSLDGTTRVWNTESGKEVFTLISFTDGTWVVVDDKGNFDSNSLEKIAGLNWVMPDNPLVPLPVEIFMRDYYEPNLLQRVFSGEEVEEKRPLLSINRTQPTVDISEIIPDTSNPDMVSVKVSVQANKNNTSTASDFVYGIRLFRDGQLVGHLPKTNTNSITKSMNELEQWRMENRIELKGGTDKTELIFESIRLPRHDGLSSIEFTAYAFNDDRIKSETSSRRYKIPQKLKPRKGRAYIVTIGINAYHNKNLNLLFAANDAKSVSQALSERLNNKQLFDEVIEVPLVSEKELLFGFYNRVNDKASKSIIKAVFDLLSGKSIGIFDRLEIPNGFSIKEARPEDFVFIFYAGHGYINKNGGFFLFPSDVTMPGSSVTDDSNINGAISSKELSSWLQDVDGGEINFVIDACYSSSVIEAGFKPGPLGDRGLGQMAYDKGMRILAATQNDNVAIESEQIRHGLLAYSLVREGLEDKMADFNPIDNIITLNEWLKYPLVRLPKLYSEIIQGNLSNTGKKELKRGVFVAEDNMPLDTEQQMIVQKPVLFDFLKKRQEIILEKYHVSNH